MEQKRERLNRLCIAALAFLTIVVLSELVDFYVEAKNILQYIENSPYMSSPYQDVIFPDNWFSGAFSGFISIILPPIKFVILGIVLLRIVRTNQPFSDQNKKSLKWYGILEAAQVFTSIFSWNFKFSSILNFLLSCAVIIIWFCWPGSTEQNTSERESKKARKFYVVMVGVQILVVIVNAFYYFENSFVLYLHNPAFLFSVANISFIARYVFSCAYVAWFYNQIGKIFRSVGAGVSKFDPINISRFKKAAWIRIIGSGVSAIISVWAIAKYILEVLLHTDSLFYDLYYIFDIIKLLMIPFVILCLAFAYEYGASTRLENEKYPGVSNEMLGGCDV